MVKEAEETSPLRRQWKGVRVGPYQIERVLGHGATSTVFEAKHTALGRPVAVKLLHEHLAGDERLRQRFLREGRIASQLRHPNVVDVIDVGEHDGIPYLVMELLDGADLGSWLRAHGRLTVTDAISTVLPLASALVAAHSMGTLHRDLKPGNVVLAHDARGDRLPKLVDFGLSKRRGGDSSVQLTQGDAILGTLGYMAPEQLIGGLHADERSDQYGLAAILYECLVAAPPYSGATVQELLETIRSRPVESMRVVAPEVPPELDVIVLRGLAHERDARFDDVREFGAALLPFADGVTRHAWARDFVGRAELPRRPSDGAVVAATPTVVDRASTPAKTAVVAEKPERVERSSERLVERASERPVTAERALDPPAEKPRPARAPIAAATPPPAPASGPHSVRRPITGGSGAMAAVVEPVSPSPYVVTPLPIPAGTSKFRMKGVLYRGVVLGIEHRIPGGLDAFAAGLADASLRAFVRQSFLASSFYDALPMLPLMQALAAAANVPFERFVVESGAAQARMDAKGVYRTMLQSDSTDFAARVSRWSQRHYDFGQAVVEAVRPGNLILHRSGYPTYMLPWFVSSSAEYMAEVARLSGLSAVTVRTYGLGPAGRVGDTPVSSFDTELTWRS